MDRAEEQDDCEGKTTENVSIVSIIEDFGECGRFQILFSVLAHTLKMSVCFSMINMIFGAAVPAKWWCVDDVNGGNMTSVNATILESSFKSCKTSSGSKCTNFIFSDEIRTLVNEFDLVCDLDWVPSTIISIQMAGFLVGSLICGQIADTVGRKIPFYISIVIVSVSNIMAASSVSWVMFAVCRFLIGIGGGFFMTLLYNYQSEFTTARWRPIMVAFPSWAIEICAFALVAYLCKDWKKIHYVTAAVSAPFLLTWWFVPESFRWYMANDRAKEAAAVVKRVAHVNGRPEPDMEQFHKLAQQEAQTARTGPKYTILDLFKSRQLLKLTGLLFPIWLSCGMVNYGIAFGIQKLSGDLYINIFIFGIVMSPINFICIYLKNKIGRQRTTFFALLLTTFGALAVAIIQQLNIDDALKGKLINAFSLVAYIGIDFTWPPLQTLTLEAYPTVVRNIGYGFQNVVARFGAIIGPQLAFLDDTLPGVMYFACVFILVLSAFCALHLPETMNKDLPDKIGKKPFLISDYSKRSKDQHEEDEV